VPAGCASRRDRLSTVSQTGDDSLFPWLAIWWLQDCMMASVRVPINCSLPLFAHAPFCRRCGLPAAAGGDSYVCLNPEPGAGLGNTVLSTCALVLPGAQARQRARVSGVARADPTAQAPQRQPPRGLRLARLCSASLAGAAPPRRRQSGYAHGRPPNRRRDAVRVRSQQSGLGQGGFQLALQSVCRDARLGARQNDLPCVRNCVGICIVVLGTHSKGWC
jgi:hypothetical protein